jgi:hypothetical protein
VPLKIHAEDQYAEVPAQMPLATLQASLPEHLHYAAPSLERSVGDWVHSGGVGLLTASPVRRDVLGLSYRSDHGLTEAGGRVVKNVSGYDLVRLIVGADPSLQRTRTLETLTLRLRPRPVIAEREETRPEDQLDFSFAELEALGAVFGLAYRVDDSGLWQVRGVWWGAARGWGRPAPDPVPAHAQLRDRLGMFPRPEPERTELEQRLLAVL